MILPTCWRPSRHDTVAPTGSVALRTSGAVDAQARVHPRTEAAVAAVIDGVGVAVVAHGKVGLDRVAAHAARARPDLVTRARCAARHRRTWVRPCVHPWAYSR